MASSIQPAFAAARTRHWSGVMVRYHGGAVGGAPAATVMDLSWGGAPSRAPGRRRERPGILCVRAARDKRRRRPPPRAGRAGAA
ncbi:MAG: hypothetical protein AMXMBFR53_26310 [Gemmatimonadota bacterium]